MRYQITLIVFQTGFAEELSVTQPFDVLEDLVRAVAQLAAQQSAKRADPRVRPLHADALIIQLPACSEGYGSTTHVVIKSIVREADGVKIF